MRTLKLLFLLATLSLSFGCTHTDEVKDQREEMPRKVANEAVTEGVYHCSTPDIQKYFGKDIKFDEYPVKADADQRISAQIKDIMQKFDYLMKTQYYGDQRCNTYRVEEIINQANCLYVFSTLYYPYDKTDEVFQVSRESFISHIAAKEAMDIKNSPKGISCQGNTYLDKLKTESRVFPFALMLQLKLAK